MFFSLSGAEKLNNNAKLTQWKVQLPGYAVCQNGRFWKTTTSVCRKPTDQKTKRLQETAYHNIMTVIPVFQRHKASADIKTAGTSVY